MTAPVAALLPVVDRAPRLVPLSVPVRLPALRPPIGVLLLATGTLSTLARSLDVVLSVLTLLSALTPLLLGAPLAAASLLPPPLVVSEMLVAPPALAPLLSAPLSVVLLLLVDVRMVGVVLLLSGRGALPSVLVDPIALGVELPRPDRAVLAAPPLAYLPVALAVLIGVGLLAHVAVADGPLSVLAALLSLPAGPLALLAAGRAGAALGVLLQRIGTLELPAVAGVPAAAPVGDLPILVAIAPLLVAVGPVPLLLAVVIPRSRSVVPAPMPAAVVAHVVPWHGVRNVGD